MEKEIRQKIRERCVSPSEAVKTVRSGDSVYLGIASSTANALCDALDARADGLTDVTLCTLQALGHSRILTRMNGDAFRVRTGFMGPWERAAGKRGQVDFTSVHLSQIDIWCSRTVKIDVAFLEVSLPDDKGYMSYGASGVAVDRYIVEAAKVLVLQINPEVPYVYGSSNVIHYSRADVMTEAASPVAELADAPVDEATRQISDLLLEQIPDGACLQLGIGGLANAVGFGLKTKNDLGIYTEMMTDSLMALMRLGCVNNSRKSLLRGRSVCAFALGSRALYDFIDHNAKMHFAPFPVINAPVNIAKNTGMMASVNTAIEADLFGQVNADNFAGRQYTSTGGQLDFVRGAQMARGGKSFIALRSTAMDAQGERVSKIVCRLPAGTAVTTPRSDIQYLVTEFGCVNLKELVMGDRVRAMISLAHPDFRDQLHDEARKAGMLS